MTSYNDKRHLINNGYIVNEDKSWEITPTGRKVCLINPSDYKAIHSFAKRYNNIRGDSLIAYTYKYYPYYAIYSEIIKSVLHNDKFSIDAINAARPTKNAPFLCTIGYEGKTFESYLNQLILSGVAILCDVRHNPLSRKYGFSKITLSKSCENIGIHYIHMPELGIATEKRQNLKSQDDYNKLFEQYTRETLPLQMSTITKIRDWIKAGSCVALGCYEQLPIKCHRHCIADFMVKEFGLEYTPKHL